MRLAIPILLPALLILAACGGSSTPETTTITAPVSTEAATTEAAPPVFYAGKAKDLLTPVRSLGEGWAKDGNAQTVLAGKRGIFATEQPWKRSAPIAKGVASIANQDFRLDDGLASKTLYHTVIVYESDESAQTALDAALDTFTSLPSAHFVTKDVNPPILLGADAHAARGSVKPGDVELAVGMIAWRQANIVQAVSGRGYISAPNALVSRLAKSAYRQTEATLAG